MSFDVLLVSLKFFSIFKNDFDFIDSNFVFVDSNLIIFVLTSFCLIALFATNAISCIFFWFFNISRIELSSKSFKQYFWCLFNELLLCDIFYKNYSNFSLLKQRLHIVIYLIDKIFIYFQNLRSWRCIKHFVRKQTKSKIL